jgi:hypothetical protein
MTNKNVRRPPGLLADGKTAYDLFAFYARDSPHATESKGEKVAKASGVKGD